jgi:ABC-2 type transport system ATP-binding protein
VAGRRQALPERRRLIEVEHLAKRFIVRRGRFRRERHVVEAVKDISFRVERGELLGYLGPNGAGKSTTIKMLTGILVPSDGRVSVAGMTPSRQRIELAKRIGAMFGQRIQLWWDLPLLDSFELLRHIYKVPADRYRTNLARFRDVLDLDPFLNTPVRQLSLGQRIRGELTAAMLHGPELLFLDEPTIGLDVVAKQRVRDFLIEINRDDGVTVLLTTHDLGDIERMCERLLVIDHGSLIWDGGIAELRERYGAERTLIVDLEEPAPPLEIPGARVERVDGPRQWLRFRGSAAELTARVAASARLVDLQIAETDIEEIVRSIYSSSRDPSGTVSP